eukprot:GHVR01024349.1.p1 GENE.GHVR01024349.1~~GHVR01024349.1.p1  ORF type:complete len:437 (-),score=72.91 GHVR01024349.1:16-1281(-)
MMSSIRADGKHLSILVTPESLFDTNAQDMFQRTLSFFGVMASFVTFERIAVGFAFKSLKKLKYLYRMLYRVISTKEYVVTTPASLHSLQNFFIELIHGTTTMTEEELSPSIQVSQVISNILNLFRKYGTPVFDEVDVIFNPAVEHNSPVSAKQQPNSLIINTIVQLYKYIATDGNINKKINVRDSSQAEESEKYYTSAVLDMVRDKAVHIITTSDEWQMYHIKPYIKYIKRMFEKKEGDFAAATEINKINPRMMESIATIHQQVYVLFPATWKKTVNLHFGRSWERLNDPIPVPYVASNTPNERSEFSNKWDVTNKTIMTSEQASLFIMNKQIQLQTFKYNSGKANELIQNFNELSGQDILKLKPKSNDVTVIFRDKFNSGRSPLHTNELLQFVLDSVLPQVGDVALQISANPQNLASMFL